MELDVENLGYLGLLPTEIQALIFSIASIADITSISLTCHYYNLNVWSFMLTLDPTALQNLVAQAADIANSPYIDDLFSEPDPRLVEVSKVQQLPIFHKIFERASLSRKKAEKFVLHATDGFDDIKEDFLSAIERYPSFIQDITSLTAINVMAKDLERFTKLTPHLQHLDWQPYKNTFPYDIRGCKLPPLTSLVVRYRNAIFWNSLDYLLLAVPSLQCLEMIGGNVTTRGAYLRAGLSLQRLGIMNCYLYSGSAAPLTGSLTDCIGLLPALKTLDLRGSVAMNTQSNLWALQKACPNLEIVLGLYDKHSPEIKQTALFSCQEE